MKRISDCMSNVRTPGKQYILSSDMSNRQSFEESMIVDNDQDYDYITKVINEEKRCSSSSQSTSLSHLITSTNQTWISLAEYFEKYGDFPLPDWMTALIISDVSKALSQLHSNHISHDTICAENIHFMMDFPEICLMFNRSHLRKMKAEEMLESRSDNIHQLGWVFHKCLTGKAPKFQTNGDLAEPSGPFSINPDGLKLCRKMLARKFYESAQFVEMHSYVQTALALKTPRFLNLF